MWSYEAEVPYSAFGKHRLGMTEEQVWFDKQSIALATVTEVRVNVTRQYYNGVPTNVSYKVKLVGVQGNLTCTWNYSTMQKAETKARCEHAFRQLMDLLDHTVGVRVARHVADNLTQFGDYSFSPDGISARGLLGTKTIPWTHVLGGTLEQGLSRVRYVDEGGIEKTLGGMDMWAPNSYFLHEVVTAVKARYLGAPAPQGYPAPPLDGGAPAAQPGQPMQPMYPAPGGQLPPQYGPPVQQTYPAPGTHLPPQYGPPQWGQPAPQQPPMPPSTPQPPMPPPSQTWGQQPPPA